YFSSLPIFGEVESLIITQGVATVTFSEDFKKGLAGSCKVAAVRAQIEQTLKQFTDITSVQIKINGVPDEEVLQP
ncbi:MAG TPA: GerMN domain-containing protein, partial [bacterium]|nr:GerMN domain-containing protein [bacterium]